MRMFVTTILGCLILTLSSQSWGAAPESQSDGQQLKEQATASATQAHDSAVAARAKLDEIGTALDELIGDENTPGDREFPKDKSKGSKSRGLIDAGKFAIPDASRHVNAFGTMKVFTSKGFVDAAKGATKISLVLLQAFRDQLKDKKKAADAEVLKKKQALEAIEAKTAEEFAAEAAAAVPSKKAGTVHVGQAGNVGAKAKLLAAQLQGSASPGGSTHTGGGFTGSGGKKSAGTDADAEDEAGDDSTPEDDAQAKAGIDGKDGKDGKDASNWTIVNWYNSKTPEEQIGYTFATAAGLTVLGIILWRWYKNRNSHHNLQETVINTSSEGNAAKGSVVILEDNKADYSFKEEAKDEKSTEVAFEEPKHEAIEFQTGSSQSASLQPSTSEHHDEAPKTLLQRLNTKKKFRRLPLVEKLEILPVHQD